MSELLARPADPDEASGTYGGFAEIARRLNTLHPGRQKPISRQLVAKWYECRESNGFPDRGPVVVRGKEKSLFDLQVVERWHTEWLRDRGELPIETIPLFQINPDGNWSKL